MTSEEFNKLTIQDIISHFNEWNNLIQQGKSIDEIKKSILLFIKHCPFETVKAESGKLYRARKNKGDELFHHVHEITYPKPEHVEKKGRANRINEPIMYLGQDGRTALFEARLKPEEYVTVSEWEIKPGENLNLMYLASSENMKHHSLHKIIQERNSRLASMNYNKQGIENVNFIHRILNAEFLKNDEELNENIYNLSIAIAEVLLDYNESDGIVYSSIKSKNDLNIALKPKSSDRALKINKCDTIKIIKSDLESINMKLLLTSSIIDSSGKITWTDKVEGLTWNSSRTESLKKIN